MTESEITGAELTTAQAGAVLALIEAARLADGVAPLSEHGMLRLSYGSAGGGRDFIVIAGGRIAGYAYLDPPSGDQAGAGEVTGELVIHPDRRRHGLGRALTGELAGSAGSSSGSLSDRRICHSARKRSNPAVRASAPAAGRSP